MWLNPPPTTYLKSPPEQECSDGACASRSTQSAYDPVLWVHVNSTLQPRPRSWRGWKRRGMAASLFGTMQRPSHPGGGAADLEAWLTSSAAATPASRSASPVSGLDTAILATFGRRVVASLQGSNPASCSSKTLTDISARDLEKSFGICGDLATELRAACTARRKSARRTFERGCSSWDSPKAPSGGNTSRGHDRIGELLLGGQAKQWASANEMDSSQRTHQMSGDRRCEALPGHARQWASPTAKQGGQDGPDRINPNGGTTDLKTDAQNWPSARGEDSESCGNHPNATDSLTGATKSWPTASARDHKGAPEVGSRDRMTWQLDEAAQPWTAPESSHRPETTTDNGLDSLLAVWTRPSCPRLTPAFQLWLMGWPHPLICFGSVATALSRSAPPGHLSTCGRASWNQWWSLNRQALCSLVSAIETMGLD